MAIEVKIIADATEYIRASDQVAAANDRLKKSTEDTAKAAEETFSGVNTAPRLRSIKQITDAYQTTERQVQALRERLNELNRRRETAISNDSVRSVRVYNQEIAKTTQAINLLENSTKQVQASTDQTASSFDRFTRLATRFISVAAIGRITRSVIELSASYEQSIDRLSSITGLVGDPLEELREGAIEAGLETTKSADEILRAYGEIGSKAPDLLQDTEGLQGVTRDSITLADAMGGEVLDAATAITGALNQFDIAAENSGLVINALAAGSQVGAANIQNLNDSIKVSGTVLSQNNIPFEQAIGIFETLGEKQILGAEAGTQLRNVILRLANSGRGFVNGQFDIIAALEQTNEEFAALPNEIERSNEATKLFGERGITVGNILRANIETIGEYQDAVTGTNVAQEQAETNTDNLTGAYGRFGATLRTLVASNAENSGLNALLTSAVNNLRDLVLFVDRNASAVGSFIAVLASYRVGMIAYNTVTRLGITNTRLFASASALLSSSLGGSLNARLAAATRSFRALNTVMRANVIGLVVSAVAGAVLVFRSFNRELSAAERAQNAINDITQEVDRSLAAQQATTRSLVETIESETASLEDKQEALNELQRIAPAYFRNLQIEDGVVKGLTTAYNEYVASLKEAALQRSIAERSVQFESQILEAQQELNEANETYQRQFARNLELAKQGRDVLFIADPEDERRRLDEIQQEYNEFLELANQRRSSFARQGPLLPDGSFNPTQPEAEEPPGGNGGLEIDLRQREQLRLSLLEEGLEKELALERFAFENLQEQLRAFNLSDADARDRHNERVLQIRADYLSDLESAENATQETILAQRREYFRTLEELESGARAVNGGELTDTQSAILLNLRLEAEEFFVSELEKLRDRDIKSFEDALQAEEELQISRIRLNEGAILTEEQQQSEILRIRQETLEKLLEFQENILGADGSISNADELIINNIKLQIQDLQNEINNLDFSVDVSGFSFGQSLSELFNLNLAGEDLRAFEDAVGSIGSSAKRIFDELNANRIEALQDQIAAYDDELNIINSNVQSKEDALRQELDLQNQGKNARVEEVQEELRLEQQRQSEFTALRNRAVEDQKRAQRAQLIADSAAQLSSLITAAANIFEANSKIPIAGQGIAIAQIALMFGAFAAAKIRAFQSIERQQLRKGGAFIIEGASHESGGVTLDRHHEAEGGEGNIVLSKDKTRRIGLKTLKGLHTLINEKSPQELKDMIDGSIDVIPVDLSSNLPQINNTYFSDFSAMEKELRDIKKILKEPQEQSQVLPDGRLYVRKGTKKLITKIG